MRKAQEQQNKKMAELDERVAVYYVDGKSKEETAEILGISMAQLNPSWCRVENKKSLFKLRHPEEEKPKVRVIKKKFPIFTDPVTGKQYADVSEVYGI